MRRRTQWLGLASLFIQSNLRRYHGQGQFPPALADVPVHEGGHSVIRSDPGNWTGGKVCAGERVSEGHRCGVHPRLDIKYLTDAKIAEFYQGNYWRKIRGNELPAGVDCGASNAR